MRGRCCPTVNRARLAPGWHRAGMQAGKTSGHPSNPGDGGGIHTAPKSQSTHPHRSTHPVILAPLADLAVSCNGNPGRNAFLLLVPNRQALTGNLIVLFHQNRSSRNALRLGASCTRVAR